MLWNIFVGLSILWVISEIAIGWYTRSGSTTASKHDRNSLRLLWIIITASVSIGVWGARHGLGDLPLPHPPLLIGGMLLIVLGLILRWSSVFTLKRFFTSNVDILPDHQLIQHGVYGKIRHPAYAGALLSFFGLGIALGSWFSLTIIFLPITAIFLYRIRLEEAALREAFGKEYEIYCQKTSRLIPGIF